MKNLDMANKGMLFEKEVQIANKQYQDRGIALVQKISTPWKVIRKGKHIVSAFPEEKSTLDFRGTVKGGISISFDCKEVEKEEKGLPLKNISDHQIEYIENALNVGEKSFILCYMKVLMDLCQYIGHKIKFFRVLPTIGSKKIIVMGFPPKNNKLKTR